MDGEMETELVVGDMVRSMKDSEYQTKDDLGVIIDKQSGVFLVMWKNPPRKHIGKYDARFLGVDTAWFVQASSLSFVRNVF